MNSNFLNHEINASEALTLYLKHYPRKNDIEFDAFYGAQSASTARALVRGLLDEAMSLRPDWSHMTLNDAGDFVEELSIPVDRGVSGDLRSGVLTAV